MAVRETTFLLTLPSLLLRVFSPPPPNVARKDGYEAARPKPSAGALRLFPPASIFAPKTPETSKPSIGEKIKHVYQEDLKPPFNLCRHATLKMAGQYLKNKFKTEFRNRFKSRFEIRKTVREIIPHEIYNGDIDTVISGWRKRDGFEGPVRNPSEGNLRRVLGAIDAHLEAGLPVPVYVSHTTGLHVVLVTDKTVSKDGRVAYHFMDPATRDKAKSRGTLAWKDKITLKGRRGRTKEISVGNFVKPGNTDKKTRGTANQQYYLLGVYSYIDKFNAAVSSGHVTTHKPEVKFHPSLDGRESEGG